MSLHRSSLDITANGNAESVDNQKNHKKSKVGPAASEVELHEVKVAKDPLVSLAVRSDKLQKCARFYSSKNVIKHSLVLILFKLLFVTKFRH